MSPAACHHILPPHVAAWPVVVPCGRFCCLGFSPSPPASVSRPLSLPPVRLLDRMCAPPFFCSTVPPVSARCCLLLPLSWPHLLLPLFPGPGSELVLFCLWTSPVSTLPLFHTRALGIVRGCMLAARPIPVRAFHRIPCRRAATSVVRNLGSLGPCTGPPHCSVVPTTPIPLLPRRRPCCTPAPPSPLPAPICLRAVARCLVLLACVPVQLCSCPLPYSSVPYRLLL